MASTTAVLMAMPLTSQKKFLSSSDTLFKPLPMSPIKSMAPFRSNARREVRVQASLTEKAAAGLTAATLSATMVLPEVAEAAGSDLSPSLKNFLLSIAAGGVVLTAILGAVIGVSNFDPVKRA